MESGYLPNTPWHLLIFIYIICHLSLCCHGLSCYCCQSDSFLLHASCNVIRCAETCVVYHTTTPVSLLKFHCRWRALLSNINTNTPRIANYMCVTRLTFQSPSLIYCRTKMRAMTSNDQVSMQTMLYVYTKKTLQSACDRMGRIQTHFSIKSIQVPKYWDFQALYTHMYNKMCPHWLTWHMWA